MSSKDWRQLRHEAEQKGWEISVTRGGHLKWKSPEGKCVFSGKTVSDHRALQNHISTLRKYGYDG